jgi:hypothetical protein
MSSVHRIEAGRGSIRELSATKLEEALRWTEGSINAILAGGMPTEVEPETPEVRSRALDAFQERLFRIIDEADIQVAEVAMRAAEAAARAVVDANYQQWRDGLYRP